jgi:hypothetical protein
MRKTLPLLAVAAFLLAGCAGAATQTTGDVSHTVITKGTRGGTSSPASGAPAPQPGASPQPSSPSSSPSPSSAPSADARMTIRGVVVDAALHPLQANVTILETGAVRETGAGGAFRFEDLRPDVYFLTARSAGFRAQTLSVTPEAARQEVRFQLEATPPQGPYNQTHHLRGAFECALEVLILSPSCDSLITDEHGLGHPELGRFNDTSALTVDVQDGWRTIVGDLVFDGSSQPLLDGLRVTVKGSHNQTGLGTYEQYGRFDGRGSFTFRVEPGATYPDGTAGEVPQNTTSFKFNVYPHSHAWHTLCVAGGPCFLGVGAGLNVEFDLFVTVFYGAPAPEGFTMRAGA